jgi:5-methylcytosine-specific restriction enzyme A
MTDEGYAAALSYFRAVEHTPMDDEHNEIADMLIDEYGTEELMAGLALVAAYIRNALLEHANAATAAAMPGSTERSTPTLWMTPMPEMPVACITCGRPVPYGKSRCPAHTFQSSSRWAQHAAQHPEQAAYYASAGWRERRAAHLRDNPDCVVCGRPARHVDHVINIASGGSLGGPLQSLCKEHHAAKTQAESKQGNRRAAAARRRRQP